MNAARRERRAGVMVTRLSDGDQRFVAAAAFAGDPLAGSLETALRMGKSGVVAHRRREYFLTVQAPAPRLTLIGAVHISQALAPMARIAGLDVTVIDPRTAFATPERFPDTPVVAEWPDEALAAAPPDRYTAVCLLTHDPKIDDPALGRRARGGLLLHRRARLEEDPREAARADAGERVRRRGAGAHPCADRPRHRRGEPGGDRGVDHRRDRRRAAPEAAAFRGAAP